jgi:hypothetical protein
MNHVACEDCGTTMTRGNAHIRSVALQQVAFCDPCWSLRVRFAEIVREVCAEVVPMPLTRRLAEAGVRWAA